jgi:hypothetical protein
VLANVPTGLDKLIPAASAALPPTAEDIVKVVVCEVAFRVVLLGVIVIVVAIILLHFV